MKLKNLRMLKNLTQEELAERTDLTKGYISQIESQHASPSMETFLNILEVLGTRQVIFFRRKLKKRCFIQLKIKQFMMNMTRAIF